MIKKTCPWCAEKTSINHLGLRPQNKQLKWYQVSRNVKTCPYCAGAVSIGGKGMKFLVLLIPLFVVQLLEIFTSFKQSSYSYLPEFVFGAAVIGFVGCYLFLELEKSDRVSKEKNN